MEVWLFVGDEPASLAWGEITPEKNPPFVTNIFCSLQNRHTLHAPKVVQENVFQTNLGDGNSNICYFQPLFGEDSHFDYSNIFQMGWFNHQAAMHFSGAGKAVTPRKFNIAPKNRQSQKETHLPTIIFQGLC